MQYRADIQGLRAVAILPVVLFHAGGALAPGGYVGVDVFFVISGFLITTIVARELDAGAFTLGGFYRRRVLRLFPALYAMLAVSFAGALLLLSPAALREFGETALATVFFLSNLEFARLANYFASAAELKPLLHTWSLAVEEQFYLLYPLLMMLTWRLRRPGFLALLAFGALVSVAASLALQAAYPAAAFYLPPVRAVELLIGAIVAQPLLPAIRSQRLRELAAAMGLALIAVSVAAFDRDTPLLAVLVPCVGAALIIHAGRDGSSLAGRLLSLPALTFIGAISYSLYLWHWPLLVFARHHFLGSMTGWQTAAVVAVAVVASILSWRFIERPFLKTKLRTRTVLLGGLAAMAVAAAASALLMLSGGLPDRFSPKVQRVFAGEQDFSPHRERCHLNRDHIIAYEETCVFGAEGRAADIVIWGDSQAAELAVALGERVAARGSAVRQITATGCPPTTDYQPPNRPYCRDHNDRTLNAIIADDQVRTVFLVAYYATHFERDARGFTEAFARSVDRLSRAGKAVVIVYPMPVMEAFDPPAALGLLALRGGDPETYGWPASEHRRRNAEAVAFLDALAARTGAAAVRPEPLFCDETLCRAYGDGGSLYYNRTHLSLTGARRLAAAVPAGLLAPSGPSTAAGASAQRPAGPPGSPPN